MGPHSIMVEHVLGKDETQVRFLLGAPPFASATLRVAGHPNSGEVNREGVSPEAQSAKGDKGRALPLLSFPIVL